jgi:pilus assembly protein CpaE
VSVTAPAILGEHLRVLAVGAFDGPETIRGLVDHSIDVAGWSATAAGAAGALKRGVDVVLLGVQEPVFPAAELAAIREHTRAPVVVLTLHLSPDLLDDALAAGVSDVIVAPQPAPALAFALRKTVRVAPAAPALAAVPAADRVRGKVLTVFSPKGGTGKTVVATNLSAALAAAGQRVLLVDLDLQFGDAAIMLGLEPSATIHDLVTAPGDLDAEKLFGYTTKHPSGVDLLPAPIRPEEADLITDEKVLRILEVARTVYDVVVVDTSPFFYGAMLATLEPTDELLLLCGLDVPTLKNVRLSLQTLDLLSFPAERVRVVCNRVNPRLNINRAEIEAVLERRISFELPDDPVVPLAVNRGNPAVLANAGSDFALALAGMATTMGPAHAPDETPRPRSPWLRRFLGGAG